jgi:hypothetical protein
MSSVELSGQKLADLRAEALFVWLKAEIHDAINYTARLRFVMKAIRIDVCRALTPSRSGLIMLIGDADFYN